MSWSVGYDNRWHRDVGYGVPAFCDYPKCGKEIDRGLYYICEECGLFFCDDHLILNDPQQCERCEKELEPFQPTPDHPDWTNHKMTDPSWAAWRKENGIDTPAPIA
jgi:hypothetical protein